ncbi:ABC transporter ATP-binding protein, partial [bacterium]|nr:ABC transporter ATP-binding protein [bacterium]
PVIRLDRICKVHPLRSVRARSLKQLALSVFRKREETEVVTAANNVDLQIPRGQAVGVIGINGAGKTSLLKLIAGITPPTSGRIHTKGRILPLLEIGAGFHPDLSGYENILLQGSLFGVDRKQVERLIPDIIRFAEIENFIHMPVRHYSSGMYMRLGFAIPMHMEPDILLVDEAFAVGDIYFQDKCIREMIRFHQRGGTFLLVSHDNGLIEKVCNRAIWIDKGRIAADGKPANVTYRYKKRMFETTVPHPVPFVHIGLALTGKPGRFGSGAITFDYIDFLDEQGRLCHVFENGAPLQIRLRYRVNEPTADDMDCALNIFSYRGHSVYYISSRQMGYRIQPYPQGGEITFRIDRLDLAPATYTLILSLCKGGDTTTAGVYDMHARIYSFTILARPEHSQIAALEPQSNWKHIAN